MVKLLWTRSSHVGMQHPQQVQGMQVQAVRRCGEVNQDDVVLMQVGRVLVYVLLVCDGIAFVTPLLLTLPFMIIDIIAEDSIPFG